MLIVKEIRREHIEYSQVTADDIKTPIHLDIST